MFINNFFFFLSLIKIKFFNKKIPLTVMINITNRCNANCLHCYASFYKRTKEKEISTERIKNLISDLKKNGCLRISFSGGEPLLREDVGELIDFAKSKKMSVTLNSNGILVPKHIDKLKKLDALAISLDGRPENHDILRGKGSAEKALKGIKVAIKAKINVHVNMVIHKYNFNDIDYMLNLAKQNNFIMEFNLAIANIFGEGASSDEIKPTNEEYLKAIKLLLKRKKQGAPILFSSAAYSSVLKTWKDFSIEGIIGGQKPKGMPNCPAGRIFGMIEADGNFWACPHLIGKIKAKNVYSDGVAEAWKTANNHPCRGCYQIYHHEFGLLSNLNLKVLMNYFGFIIKKF